MEDQNKEYLTHGYLWAFEHSPKSAAGTYFSESCAMAEGTPTKMEGIPTWSGALPNDNPCAANVPWAMLSALTSSKETQPTVKPKGKHFKADVADIDMSAVDDFIGLILKENTLLKAEIKSLKEKLAESRNMLDVLEPLIEKAYGVIIGEVEEVNDKA